jgi:hypothetical protein
MKNRITLRDPNLRFLIAGPRSNPKEFGIAASVPGGALKPAVVSNA